MVASASEANPVPMPAAVTPQQSAVGCHVEQSGRSFQESFDATVSQQAPLERAHPPQVNDSSTAARNQEHDALPYARPEIATTPAHPIQVQLASKGKSSMPRAQRESRDATTGHARSGTHLGAQDHEAASPTCAEAAPAAVLSAGSASKPLPGPFTAGAPGKQQPSLIAGGDARPESKLVAGVRSESIKSREMDPRFALSGGAAREGPHADLLAPSNTPGSAGSAAHLKPEVLAPAIAIERSLVSPVHALSLATPAGINASNPFRTTAPASAQATHSAPAPLATGTYQEQLAEPRTLVANSSTLEVGLASGSNGWLRVRAELNSSGLVTAAVMASSASAADSMSRQLPAITEYLAQQSTPVASLVVHAPSSAGLASESGSGFAGFAGMGQSQGDGRSSSRDSGETSSPFSRLDAERGGEDVNTSGITGMWGTIALPAPGWSPGPATRWVSVRV